MAEYFVKNKGFQTSNRIRMILFGITFLIATFVGVSSVMLYLNHQTGKKRPSQVIVERGPADHVEDKMARVLVPVDRIETGALLEPSMFRTELVPKVGLSSHAVRSFNEIRGQYARSTIVSDMPLLSDYVTKHRPVNVVTASIPEGYRAVTIQLDARSSVEGWARPGARVDVMWAFKLKTGRQSVTTIVQNAQVLSAERRVAGEPEKSQKSKDNSKGAAGTATLLVTALDANKIQLAQTKGTLSLTLRGDRDLSANPSLKTITTMDLWDGMNTRAKRSLEGVIKVREKDGSFSEYGLAPTGELVALVAGETITPPVERGKKPVND